ncbi:MAG: hypothetical protein Q4C64_05530 [Erysipelotrichia bacterium]|nr:hypothetical protein [Erysipelotrichia bacterium]
MKKILINLLCLIICICTFTSPINAEENTDTINYGNLSAKTANVVATYGHSTVTIGGIGLSFSGGAHPAINFSANIIGCIDTMAKTSYFDY